LVLLLTNPDSATREKEAVTFAICVHTMWYKEKVSNFEIAVAKLKETLRNIKFATLFPERSVGTSLPGETAGYPAHPRLILSVCQSICHITFNFSVENLLIPTIKATIETSWY
jgi:hypothetical protein